METSIMWKKEPSGFEWNKQTSKWAAYREEHIDYREPQAQMTGCTTWDIVPLQL
jgi:hypothetical protein